jgi:hypothetical protein
MLIPIIKTILTSLLLIVGFSWLVLIGYGMSKAARLGYGTRAGQQAGKELINELITRGNTSLVIWLIRPAQASILTVQVFILIGYLLYHLPSALYLTVNHAWYWFTQIDGETRKRYRRMKHYRGTPHYTVRKEQPRP